MHLCLRPLLLCLAALCGGHLCAAKDVPAGGRPMFHPDAITQKWVFHGGRNQGQAVAAAELVPAAQPGFQQAMRVEVLRPDGKFYNGAIQLATNQAVASGDSLLIRLHFRSVQNSEESGHGFATVFLQGPKPAYKKYLVREISAGAEWQVYHLAAKVTDHLPQGELGLFIGAGGGSKPQTWEVGGIELINYGSSVPLDDLPQTSASYGGRARDAEWRAEANARIDRYRKDDFRIQILDTEGEPIQGAAIEVRQQRHAYHFGSVITAALLTGDSNDSEIYRQKVLELFNQSGTENDLKWAPWENQWGPRFQQEQTIRALQWLRAHGFYTRGHVLVWPSKKHLPKHMHPYIADADPAGKQIVLDHIEDISTATADYLDEWDVVNEPYSNHDLMDAYGDEVMVDWFKAARQHLPTQGLYLNDYGILSAQGRDRAHQQHYAETLRKLLKKGAPITGMGLQGHFSGTPTGIEKVYEILEDFHGNFPQLDIRVTEFDIQTDDEQLQADYTRDLLTIVFSHPATVGLQCWGFWAGAHWRPESAMYTRNWEEKPSARVWKELIRETWWTELKGQSDSSGNFSGRGFYGDYTLRVTHKGRTQEKQFSLTPDDSKDILLQF